MQGEDFSAMSSVDFDLAHVLSLQADKASGFVFIF
jgi:hypothetical protein